MPRDPAPAPGRSASGPSVETYRAIVGDGAMDRLRAAADRVRPWTLQHVNSTAVGGGVAEILTRMLSLLEDLGLQVSWDVIAGNDDFFAATKAFHNALHGLSGCTSLPMFEAFRATTEMNRHRFDVRGDVMFIHDPQPVGLIDRCRQSGRKWIWRCHIDVSSPCPDVWSFLQRYVRRYDALIFSVDDFSKSLPLPQYTVPPSIDPLAEKNRTLTDAEVREVLERHQLDPARPILTQISRFDRLKDPLGVVQAYRLVRRHQDCQLVLAGGGADDDPEGAEVLHEVREAAGGDPDIHVLELPLFSDHEINALVRGSTVVMQKSIKEGFGLTVSEALWKRKAVVAGRVGGIRLQIRDGHSGFLVDSPELAARRVIRLLEDPELRRLMGERGHRHVKRNFLITRHMADYLRVAHLVLQQSSRARVSVPATVQAARAACA